jgi:hypothetical protein
VHSEIISKIKLINNKLIRASAEVFGFVSIQCKRMLEEEIRTKEPM